MARWPVGHCARPLKKRMKTATAATTASTDVRFDRLPLLGTKVRQSRPTLRERGSGIHVFLVGPRFIKRRLCDKTAAPA